MLSDLDAVLDDDSDSLDYHAVLSALSEHHGPLVEFISRTMDALFRQERGKFEELVANMRSLLERARALLQASRAHPQ
jgi:hypothetical protein